MKIHATQDDKDQINFCTRRCRLFFLKITILIQKSVCWCWWLCRSDLLSCNLVSCSNKCNMVSSNTQTQLTMSLLIPAVHYPLSQLQFGSILSGFPRSCNSSSALGAFFAVAKVCLPTFQYLI